MTRTELDRISKYILHVYKSKAIKESDIEAILQLTKQDKKNEGDKIKCSLLNSIGNCTFNINIDHNDIKTSIKYFNSLLS